MRKTKIVCTIGPASQSEDMLRKLIKAGMNVGRFNFSHGDYEEHKAKFLNLKKIRVELNKPIATLLDTKGPEIRLGDFKDHKIQLKRGQEFTLTTDDILGDETKASVTYKGLVNDVKAGGTILIDDGLIELHIDKVGSTDIVCTVLNDGPVSDKKGVNVPGTDLSMPFISEKDRQDIIFGCRLGFDMIAASFTRTAEDIVEVRKLIESQGASMKIIAKIESVQGVRNVEEILKVADGVMVARGDLGVEIPLEEVPSVQKQIIKLAEKAGKQVITATQMLDSMIHNPRPTRAETTDVANAIYDGTTAIMLSGETANGAYPVEAVEIMSRIAERTERDIDYKERMIKRFADVNLSETTDAISHAACTIAQDIDAAAIITVTMSGFTAEKLSRYKPTCPILACSPEYKVACQSNLLFDTFALVIEKQTNSADELIDTAVRQAEISGYIKAGDKIVLTAGMPLGVTGRTNMIRVIEVGKDFG
ncbi:MAG: pyruvate kinase [Lachnospiraceae bacterium]|nr:pyruvate kinase [Lachnospiraceae bacterium]